MRYLRKAKLTSNKYRLGRLLNGATKAPRQKLPKEIKRKKFVRWIYSPRRRFEAPISNNHANHARNTLDIDHEMQQQREE